VVRLPFTRPSPKKLEEELQLSRVGLESLKAYVPAGRPSYAYASSVKHRAQSRKDQLAEDLEDAYTDEEKAQVVQHWIYKLMQQGNKQRIAERVVMRMLDQLDRESLGGL